MKAQFKFLSGARVGQVEAFGKAYIGIGRHPLSDVRFDAERDLDVSSRHAAVLRKGEAFVLQDLGSRNGTFLNGQRIGGDTPVKDGDVIGFGSTGPAVEFHILPGATGADAGAEGAEGMAARASEPRQVIRATPVRPSSGSSTGVRVAAEVARQTAHLRRTTKVLLVLLVLTGGAFGWLQLDASRRTREAAQALTELQAVRDALAEAQAETARLQRELAAGGGDAATIARLRARLADAERRQRALTGAVGGVDYRSIARRNQDAVAMVLVEFSDTARYSATGFAVDSSGTVVTNKHVLVGERGTRVPRRIGVVFSGSTQVFRAELVGVASDADIAVLRVTIRGGTPRVAALVRTTQGAGLERGDPVAILGYPLGFDLPMEAQGRRPIAEPTLTVGTVSKVLAAVVQVDGYGAPGSSGSPIFDRAGRVVAVLYGGEEESRGKIVFAVPAPVVANYLRTLGLLR